MGSSRAIACVCGPLVVCLGCGPSTSDDDVYPRNCGMDGPVDLLETSPYVMTMQRAGDHYLIEHSPNEEALESWAVDRCGRNRVLLRAATTDPVPRFGTAGDHLLSCDDSTGAMAFVDPRGVDPPHALFEAVEGCRVVRLGDGLAAQQLGGGTVWFHPDPTDPAAEPIVVTDGARLSDPDWIRCYYEFDCDSDHPFGVDIRTAGDELLVAFESGELLAFSPASQATRIVDPGPLSAMDVLTDQLLVVKRDLGPTLVMERETGESFEFCCFDDVEPIRKLGDWVVKGWLDSPMSPEPATWTNFRARHLYDGTSIDIEGDERWSPVARLDDDTALVDIGPVGTEGTRYVVALASGQRQPVDLPGDTYWTLPDHDGAFAAADVSDATVRHLAGRQEAPRVVLEGVSVAFPTREGRIVFERVHGPLDSLLAVMLPDESVVEIEDHVAVVFGDPFWFGHWPEDRDEVLYAVTTEGRTIVRRTVLP